MTRSRALPGRLLGTSKPVKQKVYIGWFITPIACVQLGLLDRCDRRLVGFQLNGNAFQQVINVGRVISTPGRMAEGGAPNLLGGHAITLFSPTLPKWVGTEYSCLALFGPHLRPWRVVRDSAFGLPEPGASLPHHRVLVRRLPAARFAGAWTMLSGFCCSIRYSR